MEYHESGVSFKRKRKLVQEVHSLLDVEFRDGTLLIPLLEINNLTEAIFRNLVALEIETAQHGYDVASYVLFMSDLLSMPEDVTFLSQKDIIIHNLGSDEEVSQLFKGVRIHAPSNMKLEQHMRNLYCQLEKHHGSQWNRWGAWLKHRHFSNPWLFVALLAAVVILFFTVLQGVYAAISSKHH
ncbi:hypothetical protein LUZ60_001039 [Juncus effusus]|nr:hypothetical protein LUZ60_001039 [Juncus effusus]